MPPFGYGPPLRPCRPFYQQVDESEIRLDSVSLKLNRSNTLRLPFEVSLIIPRAEIRRRWYQGGQLFQEEEYKLSGITLVHSPRYPYRPGLFPGGRPGGPAFPEPGPAPAPTPAAVPASPLPAPPEQQRASEEGQTGQDWPVPPAKPARPVQPARPDTPIRSRQPACPAPEQNPDAEAVLAVRPFTRPSPALSAAPPAPLTPPTPPGSPGSCARPLPPAPPRFPGPPGPAAPPPPPAPPGSPAPQSRTPRITIVTRRGKEQAEEKINCQEKQR